MSLEKDEQALALFYERVDAGVFGSGEDTVAGGREIGLREIIPARMGSRSPRRHAGHQRMVGDAGAIEQAETLVVETAAADAIDVQNRGVRGQAGPDGGARIFLGPLDDAGERSPVGLIGEIGGLRFVAGDDQRVELAVPEVLDAGVKAIEMTAAGFGPWNVGQGVEGHADGYVLGGGIEQREELALGRLERSIGHVIDDADLDTVGGRPVEHHGVAQPLAVGWNSIQIDRHQRSSIEALAGTGSNDLVASSA